MISFDLSFLTFLYIGAHVLGLLAAVDALFQTRSSQGAIAWFISLNLYPYLILPIYLVFGRPRLRGYRKLVKRMSESAKRHAASQQPDVQDDDRTQVQQSNLLQTVETIANRKFSRGNSIELLSDGKAFFQSLLQDIRNARTHICICFYLIRNDEIGTELQQELIAAAKRGVIVWFLYDKVGSMEMKSSFVTTLQAGGVTVIDFHTRRGWNNLFQVNSRNHRKIVVVDHQIAYVGGFNVGDEYLGKSKELGYWRDTQVRIIGPEARAIELIFRNDWAWATQEKIKEPVPPVNHGTGEYGAITIATGSTDEKDECILLFLNLITGAKERLWITTPYFVPDDSIIQAINLASLRGVDVRLLVPSRTDNLLTWYASWYHLPLLSKHKAKVYRYDNGFLHQKVFLVDDIAATVGSVNLDNRSLRLSFEITTLVPGAVFADRVAKMLEEDFAKSKLLSKHYLENLPFKTRLFSNLARLLSPIL